MYHFKHRFHKKFESSTEKKLVNRTSTMTVKLLMAGTQKKSIKTKNKGGTQKILGSSGVNKITEE